MAFDEMKTARVEAIQTLAVALIKTAGEHMKAHGNDPQADVIVGAAFGMAIEAVSQDHPVVAAIICEALSRA